MGRYSQARRRGGGPGIAATPPPPPVSITMVEVEAPDIVVVTFDGDVGFNGAAADANFLVNGTGFATTLGLGPTQVQLQQPFGQPPMNPGDPWSLTGQPAWADNPVSNPDAGTTV